ncbi:hypothetical protein ACQRUO_37210, partial [Kitasatospora sp. LaBMicrA B282]
MINPDAIPVFTGDLDQLEKDAGALKKNAAAIRTTGGDVHTTFQGLSACYTAPEADQLFATTAPVRDNADAFAKKLEAASAALSDFAGAARPLVSQMDQLKAQAVSFHASVQNDKNWQQDQHKVDTNANLIHQVGRIWGQFQEAERTAANKITALVNGTHFVVDDGSHKPGMYGFDTNQAAGADQTPWGNVDPRKYTGLEAAWHWTTDHVGSLLKGFFVDGVWGTVTGLFHMVNVFDWGTFTKTWGNIGDIVGGLGDYTIWPYEWAMNQIFGPTPDPGEDRQKAAFRGFLKSMVAWDEWGKDPSRALGTVVFNGLTLGSGTLLKIGKAGTIASDAGDAADAGKAGTAAKIAGAAGKVGEFVDPMTYVGKAVGFTVVKAGDLMGGLSKLHTGDTGAFLDGTDKEKLPDGSVKLPDGTILKPDGTMVHPDGTPHQDPIPVEPSAADRAHHHDPATQRQPAMAHTGPGSPGGHTPGGAGTHTGTGGGHTPGTGTGGGTGGGAGHAGSGG